MSADTVDQLLDRAEALGDLRRFEQALILTGDALTHDPVNLRANVCRGSMLLQLARPSDALHHFELALASDPVWWRAHLGRGLALDALGRTVTARGCVQKALEQDPDSVVILLVAFQMDLKLRRRADARSNSERALKLDPADPDAHVAMAITDFLAHDSSSARSHLGRALELDPENIYALNTLGLVEDCADNPDRALKLFERSSRIDPRGRGPELHRLLSSRRRRVRRSLHRRRGTIWKIWFALFVVTGVGGCVAALEHTRVPPPSPFTDNDRGIAPTYSLPVNCTLSKWAANQPTPTSFTVPGRWEAPVSIPRVSLNEPGDYDAWLECRHRVAASRASVLVASSTTTTWLNSD